MKYFILFKWIRESFIEKGLVWDELYPTPPPKFICSSPNPSTSACDFIWRESLYRRNQVKMKLWSWAPIPYEWCPYKKRKIGQRHTQRENNVKIQGEDG